MANEATLFEIFVLIKKLDHTAIKLLSQCIFKCPINSLLNALCYDLIVENESKAKVINLFNKYCSCVSDVICITKKRIQHILYPWSITIILTI